MEDYSSQRNKPSTQEGYQSVIDRNIIPMLGRMKVQDLKRPDVASMMKKMAHKPADANRTFSVMRKMFNLPRYGAIALTAPTHAAMCPCTRTAGDSPHQR